jgi:hypothetical protein
MDDTSKHSKASNNPATTDSTAAGSESRDLTASNRGGRPDTIHVDVIAGEYQGAFFDLQPRSRNHAWVGRSQGRKFRDKGISLPKDLEVSTSHGRFEYSRGKFYYLDAASTNGSRIQNMEIEPNKPYELYTGIEITVGQTIMKITLLSLD